MTSHPWSFSGQSSSEVACPAQLVRGTEQGLLAVALPAVESGPLVLDMSAVESIDAAGLGALLMLRHCAEQSATSFEIVSPSARVLEMLRVTHLDAVLLGDRASRSQMTTA